MSKLVSVEALGTAFNNAMKYLTNKMMETYSTDRITVGSTVKEFKEEFDCYLLCDSDWNWDVVGFKDEQQELLFVLKWS